MSYLRSFAIAVASFVVLFVLRDLSASPGQFILVFVVLIISHAVVGVTARVDGYETKRR